MLQYISREKKNIQKLDEMLIVLIVSGISACFYSSLYVLMRFLLASYLQLHESTVKQLMQPELSLTLKLFFMKLSVTDFSLNRVGNEHRAHAGSLSVAGKLFYVADNQPSFGVVFDSKHELAGEIVKMPDGFWDLPAAEAGG